MKFFDKVKGMINPDAVDEKYGEEYEYPGNGNEEYDNLEEAQPVYGGYEQPRTQQQAGMSLSSNALELKVVRPESFDSVKQIADNLLNKRTVVLNLEATNRETSRRIIDFLSGVAYSIDGNMKRVANNTFVITPHNVGVSGEQLAEQQQQPQQQPQPSDDRYGSML